MEFVGYFKEIAERHSHVGRPVGGMHGLEHDGFHHVYGAAHDNFDVRISCNGVGFGQGVDWIEKQNNVTQ